MFLSFVQKAQRFSEAVPVVKVRLKCLWFKGRRLFPVCRSAIEEGKGIYNNIKNFVRFQLST